MSLTPSIAKPLRRIEAELLALAEQRRLHGTPICEHAVHCLALKVACQAELLERELVDG